MPEKATNFARRLLVIMGVVLGVMAIIMVGATYYFEKGYDYITYFDESVMGLNPGSPVRYRGVEVGKVKKVRVAADHRLIGVQMKITMPNASKDMVAQLKADVTTGVYLDLEWKKMEEPDLTPRLTFISEYAVISSKPSNF